MITGFNTDIKHEGVTYHVQTEDKGVDTPLILSLVYDRGTILASKRSPYNDLLADEFDEKILAERLQKQHSLICAAIRAGRIEDLKRMTMKESAEKRKGLIAQKEIVKSVPDKEIKVPAEAETPPKVESTFSIISGQKIKEPAASKKAQETIKFEENIKIPKTPEKEEKILIPQVLENKALHQKEIISEKKKIDIPKRANTAFAVPKDAKPASVKIIEQIEARSSRQVEPEEIWDIPIEVIDEPIIEAVQIVEEEMILPAEAVEILTDSAKNESVNSGKMQIQLLNNTEFKEGERKTIEISVNRGNIENGLDKAHILVKILGSAFRPLIFHSKTDSNGIAVVHLQIPRFKTGRAAIVIKAMSEGEEIELRRSISII